MVTSAISQTQIKAGEVVQGKEISQEVFDFIKNKYPDFTSESFISLAELNHFRRLLLTSLMEQEDDELNHLDQDVLEAIRKNAILSENIQEIIDEKATFGQRVADKVASFGGSWTFIISFFSFLMIWILINVIALFRKPFDPYPFILLNLILSCLAAVQAPIIMMSQNRQEDKDRQRAEHDYKINLKAELEIKLLSEKIDHLIVHQNKKLLEIQEIQIDYLEDLLRKNKDNPSSDTPG